MKKIFALLLAIVMVMGLATIASAEGTKTAASKAATYDALVEKIYTVTGGTTYPTETLKFTSVAAQTNPDGGAANLTINDLVVTGATDQKLTINVPSFTKVGTYHFTISETAGSAQGVVYTGASIAVSAMVTYDYDDTDGDGYTMTALVGITNAGDATNTSKEDTFTNTYDMGSLAVSKEVKGNLGDTSKLFDVTVTFKSEDGKNVESAISYAGGTDATCTGTIPADWTGTKAVTIKVKHGDTVNFTNIPAGVTYTVEEADYTGGPLNGENGYDAAAYDFSDNNKAIAKSDADTVKITNNKETEVDTGIVMDSVPFVVMAVIAVLGLAAFTAKKRVQE